MFEHYYNSIQQTAITLMLFMGIYLILCNVPDKKLYKQFKCARQCIGVSFVIIGLQFLAQQTLGIRHNTPILSAALNLSTFYIVLQLSAASYISLIDKTYLFKKRIIIFFSRSFVYNIYIWVCYFTVPVPYIKYLMWIAGIIFLIELNYRTWEFFNKYRLIINRTIGLSGKM